MPSAVARQAPVEGAGDVAVHQRSSRTPDRSLDRLAHELVAKRDPTGSLLEEPRPTPELEIIQHLPDGRTDDLGQQIEVDRSPHDRGGSDRRRRRTELVGLLVDHIADRRRHVRAGSSSQ